MKNNKLNTKRIITGDARPTKNIFPLECSYCEFKTDEPIEMGVHMKKHYTRTPRKPSKCHYCGK